MFHLPSSLGVLLVMSTFSDVLLAQTYLHPYAQSCQSRPTRCPPSDLSGIGGDDGFLISTFGEKRARELDAHPCGGVVNKALLNIKVITDVYGPQDPVIASYRELVDRLLPVIDDDLLAKCGTESEGACDRRAKKLRPPGGYDTYFPESCNAAMLEHGGDLASIPLQDLLGDNYDDAVRAIKDLRETGCSEQAAKEEKDLEAARQRFVKRCQEQLEPMSEAPMTPPDDELSNGKAGDDEAPPTGGGTRLDPSEDEKECEAFSIASLTRATAPPNRERRLLGIGESVLLSTGPAQEVTWRITHGDGALSVADSRELSSSPSFVAPVAPGRTTIQAANECHQTSVTFRTIQPMSVNLSIDPETIRRVYSRERGRAVLEFRASVHLGPNTVSFENVEQWEGDATGRVSGVFARQRDDEGPGFGAHAGQRNSDGRLWLRATRSWSELGTLITGDTVATVMTRPYYNLRLNGTLRMDIPTHVRVFGSSFEVRPIVTSHVVRYNARERRLSLSKSGLSIEMSIPSE